VSYARFRVALQPTNSEKVVLSAIKCDTRCRRRGRRVTVLLPKPPAVDDVSVALYRTYITVSVHFLSATRSSAMSRAKIYYQIWGQGRWRVGCEQRHGNWVPDSAVEPTGGPTRDVILKIFLLTYLLTYCLTDDLCLLCILAVASQNVLKWLKLSQFRPFN